MSKRKLALLFCLSIFVLLGLPFVVSAQDGLTEYSPEAITAYRWMSMGHYYADQGMLTDDPDAVMAARWLAMAHYYQEHDLLVWRPADFKEAEECQAFRWLAMAQYYADHGLLTREIDGT